MIKFAMKFISLFFIHEHFLYIQYWNKVQYLEVQNTDQPESMLYIEPMSQGTVLIWDCPSEKTGMVSGIKKQSSDVQSISHLSTEICTVSKDKNISLNRDLCYIQNINKLLQEADPRDLLTL